MRVTLPGRGPYLAKDQKKSDAANKFIGVGVIGSSTDKYRTAWGDRANCTEYDEGDVIFVSINGRRGNRVSIDKIIPYLDLVVAARATIVADRAYDRGRPFNIGEREVANYLEYRGYTEADRGNGVWVPRKPG